MLLLFSGQNYYSAYTEYVNVHTKYKCIYTLTIILSF